MTWLQRYVLILVSLLLTLTSCMSSEGEQNTSSSLAGTQWQLVELQSMSDAIGISRPEDASQYTMTLNDDGTANLRLNCNRANGSWSATPGRDESGSFTFGLLAMTRALCPPGSLDERIAREAQFIRSYMVRNGRLYLSLMADGGIQVWEAVGQ